MIRITLAVLASCLVIFPASAQQWSSSQQDVLDVIVESWDAIADRDVNWTDDYVHENAIVWSDQKPMPLTRAQEKEWDRFDFPSEDVLLHTISPAAVVVEGDTAVAHYYYSLGTEDREGDRSTTHGRCTDILIMVDDSWKFISWNCGDEEDSGD